MKKNDIIVAAAVAAAISFTACSGSASGNAGNNADTTACVHAACSDSEPSQAPRIETDSVHWADSLRMGQCLAKAEVAGQYPVAGITPLVDSVRAWLGDQLSCSVQQTSDRMFKPTAADLASGSRLAAACGKAMLESARSDFKGFVEEDFSISYEFSNSFGPSYQTDKLLTYYFSSYVYLGGAHGGSLGSGQSFDANTGQKLTADNIFLPDKKAELTDLVREALWQQYFKEDCEEGATLADVLLINPAKLELPATPPLFSDEGLVFIYQQYEIAPYAAGMPACVLPYSAVKPLMSDKAAGLID